MLERYEEWCEEDDSFADIKVNVNNVGCHETLALTNPSLVLTLSGPCDEAHKLKGISKFLGTSYDGFEEEIMELLSAIETLGHWSEGSSPKDNLSLTLIHIPLAQICGVILFYHPGIKYYMIYFLHSAT